MPSARSRRAPRSSPSAHRPRPPVHASTARRGRRGRCDPIGKRPRSPRLPRLVSSWTLRAYTRRGASDRHRTRAPSHGTSPACQALMRQYPIGPYRDKTVAELVDVSRLSASRKAVRCSGLDIGVHRSPRRSRVDPARAPRLTAAALGARRPSGRSRLRRYGMSNQVQSILVVLSSTLVSPLAFTVKCACSLT